MNFTPNRSQLPVSHAEFTQWAQVESYVAELLATELTATNVDDWLARWTALANLVGETRERLWVATTVNTADQESEQRSHAFLDQIQPAWLTTDQQLKIQLVASALQPDSMAIPLRGIRAAVHLFRQENLPLLAEEQKLAGNYNTIVGAQSVLWEGEMLPLAQLRPFFQNPDRHVREEVWRLAGARQLADCQTLNQLWEKLLPLRQQIAANAGYADYCAYAWQQRQRFDYTPADPLPELYATAGARLAFDAATLGEAVALIEQTIEALGVREDN